jgi:hypothetical protein
MYFREQSTPFRDGAEISHTILRLLDIRTAHQARTSAEKFYTLREVAHLIKSGKIALPDLQQDMP